MRRPHNTRISRFRCGCRLPYETLGVGEGYASPGPVVSYRLTREELERYLAGKREGHNGIRGECFTMQVTRGNFEVMVADNGKRKSRLEIAREKLSREKYEDLKSQGVTDKKICADFGIHPEVLCTLKKEWGLIAAGNGQGAEDRLSSEAFLGVSCVNLGVLTEVMDEILSLPERSLQLVKLYGDLKARVDRLESTLGTLKERIEELEYRYGLHRHQVGPGHWSGKAEV